MRLRVERDEFVAALAWCHKAVGHAHHLPALSGALLTAGDGKVTIRCTDLSVTAIASVPAAVDEDGTALLPRRVVAAVQKFPDAPIAIHTDDRVTLKCGRVEATAANLDVADFPTAPEVDGPEVKVGSDLLARIAKHVTVNAGEPRDKMFFLPYVQTIVTADRIRWFATDSYSAIWIDSDQGGGDVTFHVDPRLWTAAPTDGGTVVQVGERHVAIGDRDRTLIVARPEQAYADGLADRIYPQGADNRWTLDKADLLSALSRVEAVVGAANGQVRIGASGDQWQLAATALTERYSDSLDVAGDGDVEFYVNPAKFRRAVDPHRADTVTVAMKHSMSTIEVTSDDSTVASVVMPMKPAGGS